MTPYDHNRMYVQEGLDRRKALREDAAQDAIERDFRAKLNDRTAAERSYIETARKVEQAQHEADQAVAAARNKKNMALQEAKECTDFLRLVIRLFAPMLLAGIVLALSYTGAVCFTLAAAFAICACLYSIYIYAFHFIPAGKRSGRRK